MPRRICWLYFMGSLFCQYSYGTIDQEHLAFLKQKQYGLTCGKVTEADGVGARVINGRPVKQRYPWLFNVFRSRDVWDEAHSGKERKIESSVGSLITQTAIVTCGHCICNKKNRRFTVAGHACLEGKNEEYDCGSYEHQRSS